jgi:hypothetical protein
MTIQDVAAYVKLSWGTINPDYALEISLVWALRFQDLQKAGLYSLFFYPLLLA